MAGKSVVAWRSNHSQALCGQAGNTAQGNGRLELLRRLMKATKAHVLICHLLCQGTAPDFHTGTGLTFVVEPSASQPKVEG